MVSHDTASSTQRPPGAAPFFIEGGATAVLLIHGYTGIPDEVRGMGTALANAGYTVKGILLPGHGGQLADMQGVPWQAWVETAERTLRELQDGYPQVVVLGFSMGALIALHLAAHYPVAGLILLAPALTLRSERPMRLAGIGKYILPWLYVLQQADFGDPRVQANIRAFLPDADLNDPAIVAQIKREVRLPTASIHELMKLKAHVTRQLRRVVAPVLVMQSRDDETVDPVSADQVLQSIGSADKRVVWFEHSGHMLPRGREAIQVWQVAARWLHEHYPIDVPAEHKEVS